MDFDEAKGYRTNNLDRKVRLNLEGLPEGQRNSILADFGNKIVDKIDYTPVRVEVCKDFVIFELSLDGKNPIKYENGLHVRVGNVWLETVK